MCALFHEIASRRGTPFLQAKTALLRLANEHSELKASLGDLTVKYKELAQRVNSMESNGHHPTYRNDLIDGDKMIEILPGSKILVSAWQLEKAKKKQKVSLFAARMFTELCPNGVVDVYRKSKSGKSFSSSKQKFSPVIFSNLLAAANHHIKERKVDYETEVGIQVTHKLANFNSLFKKLKQGKTYNEKLVKEYKLGTYDVLNLKLFDEFKFNPEKFSELDLNCENSTTMSDSAGAIDDHSDSNRDEAACLQKNDPAIGVDRSGEIGRKAGKENKKKRKKHPRRDRDDSSAGRQKASKKKKKELLRKQREEKRQRKISSSSSSETTVSSVSYTSKSSFAYDSDFE